MTQERIEIQFKPKGDQQLIAAIKQLDIATKRLQGSTSVYEKEVKKSTNAQKKLRASTEKTNRKLRLQSNAFATIRSNLLLYSFGVGLAQRAMIQFVEKSSKIENLERGFNSLTQTIDSSGNSLLKLQQATDGTVSSTDLLQQANNAMMLGVVSSDEEMARLFDTAQRLGQALGKDTVSSVESLVTGMGRQSRLMLDNLGIIVKSEDAYKKYAKAIGISVENLTDQQKKTAFNVEVLRIAEKMVKDLGKENLNTAADIQRMQSAAHDLSIVIGKTLEPVVKIIADSLQILSKNMNPEVLIVYATSMGIVAASFISYSVAVKQATIVTTAFLKITKVGFFLSIAVGIAEMTTRFFGLRDAIKPASDEIEEFSKNQEVLEENTVNASLAVLDQTKSFEELLKIGQRHNKSRLEAAKNDKRQTEITIARKNAELEAAKAIMKAGQDQESVRAQELRNAQTMEAFYSTEVKARKAALDELVAKQGAWATSNIEISDQVNDAQLAYISAKEGLEQWQSTVENITISNDNFMASISPEGIQILEEELKVLGFTLEETDELIKSINANISEESTFQKAIDGFQLWTDAIMDVSDAYIAQKQAALDAEKATALAATKSIRSERMRARAVDSINEEFAKKQEALNKKSQKAKRTQTKINTAAGIMEIWAAKEPDNIFFKIAMSALVAATGAQQIKAIDAAKYAQGGLVGGRRHSQGGTMIEAERGEFVVSRRGVDAAGLEALNRINAGETGVGTTIVINNPILSKDIVEDELVPQIKEALRRGGDIGVG